MELMVDFGTDPHLTQATTNFLKPLNGGGPGLESLSKEDARNVLVCAQGAVNVDLSGLEECALYLSMLRRK